MSLSPTQSNSLPTLTEQFINAKNKAHEKNPKFFFLKKKLKRLINESLIDASTMGEIFSLISLKGRNEKLSKKIQKWTPDHISSKNLIDQSQANDLVDDFISKLDRIKEQLRKDMKSEVAIDPSPTLSKIADTVHDSLQNVQFALLQHMIQLHFDIKQQTISDAYLDKLIRTIQNFEKLWETPEHISELAAFKTARKDFNKKLNDLMKANSKMSKENLITLCKSECFSTNKSIEKKIEKAIDKFIAQKNLNAHVPTIELIENTSLLDILTQVSST